MNHKQLNSNDKINEFGFEPQTSHSANANKYNVCSDNNQNYRNENETNFSNRFETQTLESERKKMQNFQNLQKPTPSFRNAILVEAKEWYIEYYIWNPFSKAQELVRKQIKLKRILKRIRRIAEKRSTALQIVEEYNFKLHRGWNPFLEADMPNGYKTIQQAFDDFITAYSYGKRKPTIDSYKAFIKNITQWLIDNNKFDDFIISINKYVAIAYIDYIYIGKKNSLRTRKNNLDFFITCFNWMEERGYIKANPFKSVQRLSMKAQRKMRTPILQDDRPQIAQYFLQHNPAMLLVVNYLFVCLIRRTEMSKLQLQHILLDRQLIHVPKHIAKNGLERFVTIPDSFMMLLYPLNIQDLPKNWYIVSDANFYPGRKQINPRRITTAWNTMRKSLAIPKENQFYSLRDSGVIDYLQSGADNKTMVDHANWQSYDMISVYANHLNKKANEFIKLNGKIFG